MACDWSGCVVSGPQCARRHGFYPGPSSRIHFALTPPMADLISMLARLIMILGAAWLAAACGSQFATADATVATGESAPLRGASIGPSGFATILDAPPAPYVPPEPGAPLPLTAEQKAGNDEFVRSGRFQNEVMDEVQRLADKLRSRERGNFVDIYFENAGDPRVVFRFLRDPERTLAQYTKHPRFFARKADYSNEQLRAAAEFMMRTFSEDRVILGVGTGNKQNRAEVQVGVSEPEFRALVARKGVTIPEGVVFRFSTEQPVAEINRPIPPAISRFVRIFPRDDRHVGALHSIDSQVKVVLRDGCFRAEGGAHDGAFVLFPIGAQLFIDEEGYLAFGPSAGPGYGRVGETVVTPGSIGEITAPALVEPIHKACGPGKVIKIHGYASAAADRADQAVASNHQAFRHFRENYGLSPEQARRVLEACKRRSGSGVCMMTPPPPPPTGGPRCPPGTKVFHGICRTPEGFARPIPDWIQEILGE